MHQHVPLATHPVRADPPPTDLLPSPGLSHTRDSERKGSRPGCSLVHQPLVLDTTDRSTSSKPGSPDGSLSDSSSREEGIPLARYQASDRNDLSGEPLAESEPPERDSLGPDIADAFI